MIKLYNFDELKPEEILNRDIRAEKNVEDVVDGIIADVRARGDEALKDYALKFDGAVIENLQVTQEEIDEAFAGMDPYFLETLRQAAANIENFHRQQVHKNFVVNDKPGIVLGQKYTPIEKAGVYVPGGTAAYPSTVLMDVIPAKVAGVAEIVMTTPAGKDGKVNPVILAAAATAGVTKIFKTGGAQAVAALAYGTQSIPAVDKIVGPGNIYVATAKRKVFGKVGIDMIAGPSEILVLADGGCNPAWVAADLLSQAEHDKLASPVLVTDSADLAKAVQAELEVQIPQLPRAAIARASVDDNGKIIVCTDLHKAIEACNIIAPEHLEVCVEDPFGVLNEIKNAGSIFLGRNVPEALGDYFAGPNHTLPTSGTARFSRQTLQDRIRDVMDIDLSGVDPSSWFTIQSANQYGWVAKIQVGPDAGVGTVSGRWFRENLLARQSVDGRSLRSQCFTVSYNADLDCFIFDVYGYGHGCGMSQWGAIGYARNGWGYQDILTHYFVGTTITTY